MPPSFSRHCSLIVHSITHSTNAAPNAHPGVGLGLGTGLGGNRENTVLALEEPTEGM